MKIKIQFGINYPGTKLEFLEVNYHTYEKQFDKDEQSYRSFNKEYLSCQECFCSK